MGSQIIWSFAQALRVVSTLRNNDSCNHVVIHQNDHDINQRKDAVVFGCIEHGD